MTQTNNRSLSHFGILGMKWGVRRTPEQLGHRPLSARQQRRQEKKDVKWVTKGKGAKITEKTQKAVQRQAEDQVRSTGLTLRNASGRLSMTYVNAYNQTLAQMMNEKVGDVPAPSGKVLRFVAKRGAIGVHTALADQGYNMQQVARGVHESGRVAYKKEEIRKTSG